MTFNEIFTLFPPCVHPFTPHVTPCPPPVPPLPPPFHQAGAIEAKYRAIRQSKLAARDRAQLLVGRQSLGGQLRDVAGRWVWTIGGWMRPDRSESVVLTSTATPSHFPRTQWDAWKQGGGPLEEVI